MMIRIKNTSFIFFFLLFYFLLFINFSLAKDIELYFFFGSGCPYCAQMASYLQEIQKDYPQLKINPLEVWHNLQNQKLMLALAEVYKIKIEGVPVVFVGDLAIEGAGLSQVLQIKEEVRRCSITSCPSPIEKIKTIPSQTINWKNVALFFGGLIIFLILIFTLLKKKK